MQGIVRKIRIKENAQEVPEADRDITNRIDPVFFNLVQQSRPHGVYFEQSMGDKLLFLKRIDHLKYDILNEH